MGDFYELFYDDAEKRRAAARHHAHARAASRPASRSRWPACRCTRSSSTSRKLVKLGESVAICEQVGDSATAKGPVERKVMRIVTPGTLTDAALLDDKARQPPARAARATSATRRASPGSSLASGALRVAEIAPQALADRARAHRAGRGADRRRRATLGSGVRRVTRLPAWHFDVEARQARAAASSSARATSPASASTTCRSRSAPPARCSTTPSNTQGQALAHVTALHRRARRRVSCARRRDAPQPRAHARRCAASRADAASRCSTRCATGMGSRAAAPLAAPSAARSRGARARATTRSPCCVDARRSDAARGAARLSPTSSASPRASRCAARGRATSPACATRSRAAGAARRARGHGQPRLRAARRRCSPPPDGARTLLRTRDRSDEPAARAARRRRDRRRLRRRARRAARDRRRTAAVPARARGARARAHRHRQPQGRLQPVHGFYIEVTQRAGRQGARRLPPPPDAEERRALHHAGAQGVRGQGALGAGPRAGAREAALRRAARRARAARRGAAARRRARSRSSTCWRRSPSARDAQTGAARSSSTSALHRDRRRPPSGRRGAGRELHRQRLPARRRRASCCSSPARTWAASRPTCARSR